MTADNELDVLAPQLRVVTLESGQQLRVKRLKARQFFALIRIITHGGSGLIARLDLAALDTADAFAAQLAMVVLFSVPEAEQESFDFVASMVEPVNKDENLNAITADPELDDIITVIEAVIDQEKDDLQALGKRLKKMFAVAQKTGQTKEASSSAVTPEPSTSSPASTDGQTKPSSISTSAASGKSQLPSANVSAPQTPEPAHT